jgi:porin
MPYTTLGAGFAILKDEHLLFTFTVYDTRDRTQNSIFNQPFANGVAFNSELHVPVKVFGLAGTHLFGADWSNATFVALQQDSRFILPASEILIAPHKGTWNAYYSFDQILVADPEHADRGWGIFVRTGIADGDPNPVRYFLSGGFGGESPIHGRERDSFGIGYAYTGASRELGPIIGRLIRDGQALEAFYNLSMTPWFHLTTDIQMVRGGFERANTALVVGFRGKIDF